MKKTICLSAVVLSLFTMDLNAETVIYENMMTTPMLVQQWRHSNLLEFQPKGGPKDEPAVFMNKTVVNNNIPSFLLKLDKVAGESLTFSMDVKMEDVKEQPQDWYGVTMLINVTMPDGQVKYLSDIKRNDRFGTCSWKTLKTSADIPDDAKKVTIAFGITGTTGKATFANLKVTAE